MTTLNTLFKLINLSHSSFKFLTSLFILDKKTFVPIKDFPTGDVGFFSKNKNLFVIGRLDNIFKSGNEKISPEEIENKIKPYLKKRTFVIIKKKHKILNWQPALVIEGQRLLSDKYLNKKFEKNLSNFKIPKEINYLKKIFRNTYGKIDRNKIFNHFSNYDNYEKNWENIKIN